MNREEAERERNRLAAEQGDSTWILHDVGGEWEVVRIGIAPSTRAAGTTTESKPSPPTGNDPRTLNFPPEAAG